MELSVQNLFGLVGLGESREEKKPVTAAVARPVAA